MPGSRETIRARLAPAAVFGVLAWVTGVGAQANLTTSLICQVDQTRTFTPSLGSVTEEAPYTFTSTGSITCAGLSNGAPASLVGSISVGNQFATHSANAACDALPKSHRCADPGTEYGTSGLYGCDAFTEPCVEVNGGDGLLGCGRTQWWWQEPLGHLVGTPRENETTETRVIRWGSGDSLDDVAIFSLANSDVTYVKVEGGVSGVVSAEAAATRTGPGDDTGGCPRQPESFPIMSTRDVGATITGALWAITPASDPTCGSLPLGTDPTGCATVRLVGADALHD